MAATAEKLKIFVFLGREPRANHPFALDGRNQQCDGATTANVEFGDWLLI